MLANNLACPTRRVRTGKIGAKEPGSILVESWAKVICRGSGLDDAVRRCGGDFGALADPSHHVFVRKRRLLKKIENDE